VPMEEYDGRIGVCRRRRKIDSSGVIDDEDGFGTKIVAKVIGYDEERRSNRLRVPKGLTKGSAACRWNASMC